MFLPDTPFSTLYAVVAASVLLFAVIRERGLWAVSAVMAGNWIGTRLASAYAWPGSAVGLLDILSAVVLVTLSFANAMAVLPVAALFGLMVVSYVAADAGLLSRATMWAFADVGAYLQLLVIAGSAVGGGSGRLARLGYGGRRTPAVVRAVAKRVQD